MVKINFTNKWLYSLIAVGILLIISTGIIAYNSGQSAALFGHSGEEVNVLYNSQTITLNQAIANLFSSSNNWKILIRGSEDSDAGWTTISSTGIVTDTYHLTNTQKMNYGDFYGGSAWPSTATQIQIRVINYGDPYCIGGDQTTSLDTGALVSPKCTYQRYTGPTINKFGMTMTDGIQIFINGQKQIGCPDALGRTPLSGYPGEYSIGDVPIYCVYNVPGSLSSIKVETLDGSAGTGLWDWELSYK